MDREMPYSEGFQILNTITLVRKMTIKNYDLQVMLYKGNNDQKYVLKRLCKKVNNFLNISEEEYVEMDNFIQNNYLEYSLMLLYNACPHSTTPIFFNILKLSEIHIIATELMMNYAGEAVSQEVFSTSSEKLYNLMCQMAIALRFLETYKIEHNDIKDTNVLFEEVFGTLVIRLIDFDVGINQTMTCKTGKGMGYRGFTKEYAPPEICIKTSDLNPNSKWTDINPWKAQMYSLGVLGLYLLKFFHIRMNFTKFFSLRIEDKITYTNEISNQINYFILENKFDDLQKSIIYICEICLSHDPTNRPTAYELENLMKHLPVKDKNVLIEKYASIKTSRNPKKNDLLENISFQEKSIKDKDDELRKKTEEIHLKEIQIGKILSDKLQTDNLFQGEISNLKAQINLGLQTSTILLQENSKLKEKNESFAILIQNMKKELEERKSKEIENEKLNDSLLNKKQGSKNKNLSFCFLGKENLFNNEKEKENLQLKEKIKELEHNQVFIRNEKKLLEFEESKKYEILQKQYESSIIEQNKNKEVMLQTIDNQQKVIEQSNSQIKELNNIINQQKEVIQNFEQMNRESNDLNNNEGNIENYFRDDSLNSFPENRKTVIVKENNKGIIDKVERLGNEITHFPTQKIKSPKIENDLDFEGNQNIISRLQNNEEYEKEKEETFFNSIFFKVDISSIYNSQKKRYEKFKEKLLEMGIIKSSKIASIEELSENLNFKICKDKVNSIYKLLNKQTLEKQFFEKNKNICFKAKASENSIFVGFIVNQVPDGIGLLQFKSGVTFSTTFSKGLVVDLAIIEKDLDIYFGIFGHEFLDGIGFKFIGYKAKIPPVFNEVYFGYFSDLQFDGFGKMSSNETNQVYYGDWYRDTREGKGKSLYEGGEYYEGEWSDNKRC